VEEVFPIPTNIVIFRIAKHLDTQETLSKLAQHGIKGVAFGPGLIRLVTHLDFHEEHLEMAAERLKRFEP
jgi:threonine aldolase